MVECLPDAPLIRRVTVKRFLFCNCGQNWQSLVELAFHDANGIVAFDLVDVCEVVRSGFRRFWSSDHAKIIAPSLYVAQRKPRRENCWNCEKTLSGVNQYAESC